MSCIQPFFLIGIIWPKKEMKTQKCKNEVLFQSERKKEKNSRISTFGFQYVGRKGNQRFVLHIKGVARFDK